MSGKYDALIDAETNDPSEIWNEQLLATDNSIGADYMTSQPYVIPDEETNIGKKRLNVEGNINNTGTNLNKSSNSQNESTSLFSFGYYRKYFDLNSEEFLDRVKIAINPVSVIPNAEREAIGETSELYGYFWITATFVFLLFLSNTAANLVISWFESDDLKYDYNFSMLIASIALLYFYNTAVPLAYYLITTYWFKFGNQFSFSRLISVYGYAQLLWFPVVLVNVLRILLIKLHTVNFVLKWALVAVGGILSGLSIMFKLSGVVRENLAAQGQGSKTWIVILILSLCHLGVTVALVPLFSFYIE